MKKSIKILIVCVVFSLVCVLVGALLIVSPDKSENISGISLNQAIVIADSVATPNCAYETFYVPDSSEYSFNLAWESKNGMITGCNITNQDGTSVFWCTAESCTIESEIIHLDQGNYLVTLTFLTSEGDYLEFLRQAGKEQLTNNEEEPYEYTSNMEETVNYSIQVIHECEFARGKMFGILFGISLGLLLVYIFCILTKNDDKVKGRYDERQELVRGRGYKYGYFSIAIWFCFVALMNLMEIQIPIDYSVILCAGLLVSIAVNSGYCIWNDGYFALNEKRGTVLIGIAIVGIMNFLIGINNIMRDGLFHNGKITVHCVNILCGFLMVIIFIITLMKSLKDRRERANEES